VEYVSPDLFPLGPQDGIGVELRHVILCALGSSGDVHPFVGLGRALRRRGSRVTVITAGYFRSLVEQAGLEFVDPLPEMDFREMIRNPRIWHPLRGTRTIIDLAVRPLLEPDCRGCIQSRRSPVHAREERPGTASPSRRRRGLRQEALEGDAGPVGQGAFRRV